MRMNWLHWRRVWKRWQAIGTKNSETMFAMLCFCLNPCHLRIIVCFVKDVLCSIKLKNRAFKRYICLSIMIIIVIMVFGIRHSIEVDKCQDKDMKHLLKNVCNSYKNEEIAGNLCSSLCEKEEFHYIKCLNYKEGKAIIFAHWNKEQVILKTKHITLTAREKLGSYNSNTKHLILPQMPNFIRMLRSTVESAFGVKAPSDDMKLISKLWKFDGEYTAENFLNSNLNTNTHTQIQKAIIASMWSLVQQDEYLFLQYYSQNQFMPRLYGSCGHIYAMEYAPSTGALEPTILQWTRTHAFTWPERVNLANKILDLVKSTDSDYEEQLYFCDVKGSNFGISNNGIVKPIDLDTVFFKSKLTEIFEDTHCEQNEHCDFFDCKGNCDKNTNMCTKDVMSNNLQAICKKVFSGVPDNMFTGLLHAPPSSFKTEINNVLKDCYNLTGDNVNYDKVFEKLKHVLKGSINIRTG